MGTVIDKNGIKINVSLDNSQIVLLCVFIFFAFFLAVLLANIFLNAVFKK